MNKPLKLARANRILMLLALLWVFVVLLFAALRPTMFSPSTVTTVLQFSTILALVSLGQCLVILAGGAGIDLSVGGTMSLSVVLAMMSMKLGVPPDLVPLVCIACGTLLGMFNGFLVTRLKILPLIATLGTLFIYSGMALALTGGAAQSGAPEWLLPWGRGVVMSLPLPFITLVVPAFAVAALLLVYTAWGRWLIAMGFNERSARLVGIPVDRARLLVYGLSGLLAGLAGLVSVAWLGSGRPNIGQNLELESLTAVMLGGVAISGGVGGVGGVLAAVILLVTLKTGLLQLNVNTVWQVGIVGALLITVLLIERLTKRWS
ncbi:inner-membrane translocator [Agrobacterium albertimagni AOL15]|jgi:ribose/xylose/arabinose/galactoside ABC-type transport system permease subunit|uniref:Autoinducer 2 import system permease protein LsrC n=1 Tax=Agrobacterium albertimagni AOL15 TaxID=1156935 RepID=K2QFL9_9HYPH|nr:ABC transporter permease [Agrobacterium albertimagni]EKF59846.1 inner-membrane translocator [Agrobacterium albertimagni AOL15]